MKLVILYGKFGTKLHEKQQSMIDGGPSCGYRDYARLFGEIVYLCPQNLHQKWEKCITDKEKLIKYLNSLKNVIVWSVKHDPNKDAVLRRCKHPSLYYSCCAYNTTCDAANYSLVDTKERTIGGTNAVLWRKGKDYDKWNFDPHVARVYDYMLVGKRADKNEIWFIEQLTKQVKERRDIFWIGGEKHRHKFKTHHNVVCTPFCNEARVKTYMNQCKIHILLSEHPAEGYPQSLIESGMMGCGDVYMGPRSNLKKKDAIKAAEYALNKFNDSQPRIMDLIRECTIEEHSICKTWEQMKGYFNAQSHNNVLERLF